MNTLIGLWPIALKYLASGGAVLGLLAVVVYLPGLKTKIAAGVAICALAGLTTAYTVGIRDEHERTIARLNAALQEEIANGEKARADAERSVDRDTSDSVRVDPCNRDNWRPGQSSC